MQLFNSGILLEFIPVKIGTGMTTLNSAILLEFTPVKTGAGMTTMFVIIAGFALLLNFRR